MTTKTVSRCDSCGYPLAAEFEGQTVTCPNCQTVNEAVSQGITIPTPLFVGLVSFGLGVLLGPALISSTAAGREWLEKQAKEAIRR